MQGIPPPPPGFQVYRPVVGGVQAKETTAGKILSGVSKVGSAVAPVGGMIAGGMAGTALGGPAGGVEGAALGGGAGEVAAQVARGEKPTLHAFEKGATTGGISELSGMGIAKAGGKILAPLGKQFGESADKMMAGIIKPLLPKGVRGSGSAVELKSLKSITQAASDVAKKAGNLKQLARNVATVKDQLLEHTDRILEAAPKTAKINLYDALISSGSRQIDKALESGIEFRAHAIDKLVDTIHKTTGDELTPEAARDLRRTLLKETDPKTGESMWPSGTKMFRRDLYAEINRRISNSLPPEMATSFRKANARISKLIQAETSIDRTMAAKYKSGAATSDIFAQRRLGYAAGGAMVGGGEGYRRGGGEGAMGGAILGAAGAMALEKALGSDAAKFALMRATREAGGASVKAAKVLENPATRKAIAAAVMTALTQVVP